MKLKLSQLRQIIKEEVARTLTEADKEPLVKKPIKVYATKEGGGRTASKSFEPEEKEKAEKYFDKVLDTIRTARKDGKPAFGYNAVVYDAVNMMNGDDPVKSTKLSRK